MVTVRIRVDFMVHYAAYSSDWRWFRVADFPGEAPVDLISFKARIFRFQRSRCLSTKFIESVYRKLGGGARKNGAGEAAAGNRSGSNL